MSEKKYFSETDFIYYETALKKKTDATYVAKEDADYKNVQPDWNETNTESHAYIKNKPNIPEGAEVDTAMSDTSENAVQNKVIKAYVDGKVTAVYKFKGSIAFESLPTEGMEDGDVYNITNEFTTTDAFEEGAGKKYPAGTNIAYDSNGKWDVMAGFIDTSAFVKNTDLVELTTGEIDTIVNNVWGE